MMERPLYELDNETNLPKAFHFKYSQLIASYSTFKKSGKEDVIRGEEDADKQEYNPSPVNTSIKTPVKSFNELSNCLQTRIKSKLHSAFGLTTNQQQALLSVIISELKSSWSEMEQLPPDPFLSDDQNKEIERFLLIELINIAEDLYFNALAKTKELFDRGVFTNSANHSRLKAQLALEANQSFNVRRIQKCFSSYLKQAQSKVKSNCDPDSTLQPKQWKHFNSKGHKKREALEKLVTPPRLTRWEKDKKKQDNDLVELETQMPNISFEKVEETFGMCRNYDFGKNVVPHGTDGSGGVKDEVVIDGENNDSVGDENTGLISIERLSRSLPNLACGESWLEELGIELDNTPGIARSCSVDKLEINFAVHCHSLKTLDNCESKSGVTRESNYLAADLKRLISNETFSKNVTSGGEEVDLPPLLQALSYESSKKKPSHYDEKSEIIKSTVSSSSSVATCQDIIERNWNESTPHIQPDTVSTTLPDKNTVRLSDVRVSNRVNKSEVTLKSFPTVYNDLIGEIDASTVKWLDRNLHIGDEIREVYEEVMKTVGKDHHLFDQDCYVEVHATGSNISNTSHSSGVISGSKDARIINPSLYRNIPAPWGRQEIDEWKNSPMFGEMGRQDLLNMESKDVSHLPGKSSKSYNSWLAWWRSTLTAGDYFKYLTTQENDYLSLLYHLYDSDDSDDENDGDRDRRPNTKELELRRLREEKICEMRKLKEQYDVGYWNANSVLLGGLGKYPHITDELENNVEDCHNKETSLSPSTPTSTQLKLSQVTTPLSLQDRLERIWTLICMPDNMRLDMAIKYSSDTYVDTLQEVLEEWESAVKLIVSREELMSKLEDFERLASDPNRFFERGSSGSSRSRIKEAKSRKDLHQRLDYVEVKIKKILKTIYENHSDTVTFQGRSYLEKMKNDRTEMLYWLQQERREMALEMAGKTLQRNILEVPLSN